MSKIYKTKKKLKPIKEPIRVTFSRSDPLKIMKNNPRIRGSAPPRSMRDAHDKLVKYPKTNPARRSRKRCRKKRRKTKRNLAGCDCRNPGRNCHNQLYEENRRRVEQQREQDEREEWLRRENLRILNDAKQYNLKDKDGNDFTIENLEEAKRALSNYLQEQENHRRFNQALMDESLPIADVVALPEGIPIPTTRWQKIKNFITGKTRKVYPVSIVPESIVPESGKRKTCKKKRKKRKIKKNVAGENDMCKGIRNFLEAQNDPSLDVPFVSTMDANRYCRRRNFKRCDFDAGKCIETLVSRNPTRRLFNLVGRRKRTRKKRKKKKRKSKKN
jgi:hypothetical protein